MSNAIASYSFNVATQGKDHVFTYTKSRFGVKTMLPMIWPAMVVGGILAFMMEGGLFLWIFLVIGLPVGVVFLINQLRTGGTFTIGENAVQLNGVSYAYKDITSFYVRTPKGERSTMVIYQGSTGFGVPGAINSLGNSAMAASAASGAAIRERLREKSYKVCMLFGEKEIALASGLTERSAKVMLEKIDALV